MTSTALAPGTRMDAPAPADAASAARRTAPDGVHLTAVDRSFPTAQGRHEVLRALDLELRSGEIVAIVGPSGCGKSTLLRLVAGLDRPSAGTIGLGATALTGTDERTAVAFQEPRLLPWRTLAQNVALGLPRGTGRRTGRERVRHLLQLRSEERRVGEECVAGLAA